VDNKFFTKTEGNFSMFVAT